MVVGVRILFILLSILLTIGVLYTLYTPIIIKPIIRKFINSTYEPLNEASVIEKSDNYILYGGRTTSQITTTEKSSTTNKYKPQNLTAYEFYAPNNNKRENDDSKKLAVFFIGGSFLFNDLASHYGIGNKLYEMMGGKCDLLLLRYPIRFKNTLQQAMLEVNKSLAKFQTKYTKFYAIGYSAGALLATIFIQKEENLQYAKQINIPQLGLKFEKFVGICGLYYPEFTNNPLLTKMFKFYILRGTQSGKLYTTYDKLMESTPKFLLSTTGDFLYKQTIQIINTQPNVSYKIYTNGDLNHTFIENSKLNTDALLVIKNFLNL